MQQFLHRYRALTEGNASFEKAFPKMSIAEFSFSSVIAKVQWGDPHPMAPILRDRSGTPPKSMTIAIQSESFLMLAFVYLLRSVRVSLTTPDVNIILIRRHNHWRADA